MAAAALVPAYSNSRVYRADSSCGVVAVAVAVALAADTEPAVVLSVATVKLVVPVVVGEAAASAG
jgi:hypothetical protein